MKFTVLRRRPVALTRTHRVSLFNRLALSLFGFQQLLFDPRMPHGPYEAMEPRSAASSCSVFKACA